MIDGSSILTCIVSSLRWCKTRGACSVTCCSINITTAQNLSSLPGPVPMLVQPSGLSRQTTSHARYFGLTSDTPTLCDMIAPHVNDSYQYQYESEV